MCLLSYLLLALTISFIGLVIWEIKPEHSIMLGQSGIFVVLYCFYAVDELHKGIYILLGIVLVLGIFCAVKLARTREVAQSIKALFSPLMVTYVLYLVLMVIILWNRQVFWDDELRFWGALPKVLYQYNGALQIKEGFQVFSVDYFPGIYVYSYFFQILNRTYRDGVLFIAYAAFAAAMIMPALSKLNKWKYIPVNIIILYYIPLIFFNARDNDYAVFYRSLYVDPMLGLVAGCMVWLLLQKPWENRLAAYEFMLCSSVCILLKSSGIMFSAIAILVLACYILVKDRACLKSIYPYILIFVPLVLYYSWKLLLKIYGVLPEIEYSVSDFVNLSFVHDFGKALISQNLLLPYIYFLNGKMTFLICFVMLTVVIFSLSKMLSSSKETNSSLLVAIICLYASAIIYIIGLYGLCVGPWESGLYSFRRYICTVLQMMIVFICLASLSNADHLAATIKREYFHSKAKMAGAFLCVMILGVLFPLIPANLNNTWGYYLTTDASSISKIFSSEAFAKNETKPWTSVAFICDDPDYEPKSWVSWGKQWYGHLVNILTYENIDRNVQILQSKYYSSVLNVEDLSDDRVRFSLTNDQKMDNADYYLVMHGNYPEIPMYEWELYKVDEYDEKTGELILEYVGKDDKPQEYINYSMPVYGVPYP